MNGKRAKLIRKLSGVVLTDAVITSKYEEMKAEIKAHNASEGDKATASEKYKPRYQSDIELDIVKTRRKFYRAMKRQYRNDFVHA